MDKGKDYPSEKKAITFTGFNWEVCESKHKGHSVLLPTVCYLCKRNKDSNSYVIVPERDKWRISNLIFTPFQISPPADERVYRFWLCNECETLLRGISIMEEVDVMQPDPPKKKRSRKRKV